jgi:hypothetical protein
MRPTRIGSADLDAETLQADVMRFMAILGFCLMAILALVRNVDSLPGPTPKKVESVRLVSPPAPKPIEKPQAKREARALVPPIEKPTLEPPRVNLPAPPQPKPLAKLAPPPTMKAAPAPSRPVAVPPAPAAPPKDESLTLRFASDADFLKLASNAVIEVYAYNATSTFKLTPALTFEPAPRPSKVRELLAETIPSLVRKSVTRNARDSSEALSWGVRLPPHIEAEIERRLAKERSGVLLIDRRGSVVHVASSN